MASLGMSDKQSDSLPSSESNSVKTIKFVGHEVQYTSGRNKQVIDFGFRANYFIMRQNKYLELNGMNYLNVDKDAIVIGQLNSLIKGTS